MSVVVYSSPVNMRGLSERTSWFSLSLLVICNFKRSIDRLYRSQFWYYFMHCAMSKIGCSTFYSVLLGSCLCFLNLFRTSWLYILSINTVYRFQPFSSSPISSRFVCWRPIQESSSVWTSTPFLFTNEIYEGCHECAWALFFCSQMSHVRTAMSAEEQPVFVR